MGAEARFKRNRAKLVTGASRRSHGGRSLLDWKGGDGSARRMRGPARQDVDAPGGRHYIPGSAGPVGTNHSEKDVETR